MTWLLDANVLIAMVIPIHVHHEWAVKWISSMKDPFATCSVTQGALLRLHMQFAPDKSAAAAWATLNAITQMPDHWFWDEGFSYLDVPHRHLHSHKQITDAWLAQLSRKRGGKIATLDGALVAHHRDVAVLVTLTH